MLFATLGKLDLLTVMVILGAAILPHQFLIYAAIYLIAKGLIFGLLLKDFASKIDGICGLYLVAFTYGLRIPVLHTLVLIWLIQKTALTFIAIGIKLMVMYYEYKEEIPFLSRN